MADILGFNVPLDVPKVASSTIGTYILIGLLILVMLIIAGAVVWWYYQKKIYCKTVIKWENIAGQGWKRTFTDKAKLLRLSKDGTEVLWLQKHKMPITAYGKKMGYEEYWFAVGPDGGWYNIVMGDLDSKMGVLDIDPIDRDIKYISVALRRASAESYGPKLSWWDKNQTWVISALILIVTFAGLWFILGKIGDIGSQLSATSEKFTIVADRFSTAMAHLDTMSSGGTGLIPA